MRFQPARQPEHTDHWQQVELTCEYMILGILGTIFTTYAQKIEGLVLGSQWLTPTLLLSAGILLTACRYRRQMIAATAWCPVRIRNLEFHVRWDALPAFYPIWWDLATSEDVSQTDVRAVLQGFARPTA